MNRQLGSVRIDDLHRRLGIRSDPFTHLDFISWRRVPESQSPLEQDSFSSVDRLDPSAFALGRLSQRGLQPSGQRKDPKETFAEAEHTSISTLKTLACKRLGLCYTSPPNAIAG